MRFSQTDVLESYLEHLGPENKRARAIRVIFERAGVDFRYSVTDKTYFDVERTTQDRNATYMEHALPLGEMVIRRGLDSAGYAADEIDDFIVVSCTGIHVPGLDLQLAGRLGMRPDLRRTAIIGMGCYGSFPGLLRAKEAAASREGRLALVLSLELCSLHLQSDLATENIVSSALFSDGAAMALVGSGEHEAKPHNPY